jgi:phage terminase Nu1 subunit (DNA packaging protein)
VKRSSSNKNKSKKKSPAPAKIVSRRVPTWIGKLEECASELNLGSRRIQQLAKEGLPRAERGVYDVVACFRWYVRYLQRKLVERALPEDGDGDAGGPVSSATATRHKILSIEAELAQISLAEKREQLISIEKATSDILAIVTEIRTRILALPPRLAAEVLGETDLAVSQVKIDRSLKNALECLSQFDPDDADVVQAPRVF